MSSGPERVQNASDAMTWLVYFARFSDGELRANSLGCLNVLIGLCDEIEEARIRIGRITSRLEQLEAARKEGR